MQVLDVETGLDREVLNMNPDGWIPGVSNERNWVMLYGMDVCGSKGMVSVGDSHGRVHFLDARTDRCIAAHQLHKKSNKVSFPAKLFQKQVFQLDSTNWDRQHGSFVRAFAGELCAALARR